jgi:hypothetical protein
VGDAGAGDGGIASPFTPPPEFEDPEVPACTASDLGGGCSSSREYRRYNLCPSLPNPGCNGGYCEQAATCANWSFGYTTKTSTTLTTQNQYCERVCINEDPRTGKCFRWQNACGFPTCSATQAVNDARSAATARGASNQLAMAITGSASITTISSTQRRCTINLYNIPYANLGSDLNLCGCNATSCRHVLCGVEDVYRYAGPGTALPPANSSTPPECVSAEDATTVEARWARLRTSWLRPDLPAADYRRVSARLRTTLELYADQIAASERADTIDAFAPEAHTLTLSCEPPPRPITFPSACSPASRSLIAPRLTMCERIPQDSDSYPPRASGSAAFVLAPDCLSVIEELTAHAECRSTELEQRARDAAFRVIQRGFSALVERPSALAQVDVSPPSGVSGTYRTFPELARQLYNLARWQTLAAASEERTPHPDGSGWTKLHLDRLLGSFWRNARTARRVVGALCPTLDATSDRDGDCIPDDTSAPVLATDVAAALASTAERADKLDRNVLLSAFQETQIPELMNGSVTVLPALSTSGQAVRGETLLSLTADTLRGSLERVDALAPYNQLACRLVPCGGARPGGVDWSEEPRWAQTWALLGNLDDAVSDPGDPMHLGQLVAEVGPDLAASDPSEQPESWQRVWERVSRRRAAISDDAAAASGQSALLPSERKALSALPSTQLSPGAQALADVIARGSTREASFAATGLVDPTRTERRLRTIVSADGRTAIMNSAEALVSQLETAILNYETDRRNVVSDLLTTLDAKRSMDGVLDRRDQLIHELETVNAEHAALRITLGEYETRFAETYDPANGVDLLGDLESTIDEGAFVQDGDTRHFEVRGFNGARVFPLRRNLNILSTVAHGIESTDPDPDSIPSVSVAGPRMISIHTEGEYRPLCALQGYKVAIPDRDDEDGVVVPPIQPGTTIGPEGFTIQVSGSSAEVRRMSESAQDYLGWLGPACQIASVAAGGPFATFGSTPLGEKAGPDGQQVARGQATGSLCGAAAGLVSWLVGEEKPVSTTTSAESSTCARFSAGLRLPNTAFPVLPAGALVVLELPQGSTSAADIRDIHLVHSGSTSFFVPEASDLYFVVNDGFTQSCASLMGPDDQHRLQVELHVLQSEEGVAEQVVSAMASVLGHIRADRAMLVEQGSLLTTQLSAYRAAALTELETTSGISMNNVPESVRNAFDAYVSYELARIEVATSIRAHERRVQELQAQLQALDNDILFAGEQGRTAALLPTLRLRGLDEYTDGNDEGHLSYLAEALTELTVEDLIPLIELWHPDLLPALVDPTSGDPAVRAALARLSSAAPGTSPFSLVDDVALVVRAILTKYAATPMVHVGADRYTVGISFGRPGVAFPPVGQTPDFDVDPPEMPRSVFPRASTSDAQRVWGAVFAATAKMPSDVRCSSSDACVDLFGEGVTCHSTTRRCQGDIACVDSDDDGLAEECEIPGLECVSGQCVRGDTRATISLEASDLYRALGGAGGNIACQSAAPIVQRSALVFALGRNYDPADADVLADMSQGRSVLASINPQQPFAMRDAPQTYTLLAAPFLERTMPLVYTTYERVLPAFAANAPAEQGHRGSSVLAPMTLDFSAMGTLSAARGGDGVSGTYESSELLLVMEIDAVPSTRPTWIDTCRP